MGEPGNTLSLAMVHWVKLVRATARYANVHERLVGMPSMGVRTTKKARRARALMVQALHTLVDKKIARAWLRIVLDLSGQTVTEMMRYKLAEGEVDAVLTIFRMGFDPRPPEEWVGSAQAAGWLK